MILVIVLTIVGDLPVLLSLVGSFALLVSFLLFLIAFALGYVLGGRRETERRTGALLTGSRAAGPALLIATQAFPTQPQVMAGAVAMGVMVSVLPMIAMLEWGRHQPREEADLVAPPVSAST